MASSVVSADSHVLEPADLWTTRLDNRFRDRAPRVVRKQEGPGYEFVAPGIRPFAVATGWGLGKSGKELAEQLTKGYEAAVPAAGIQPNGSRTRKLTGLPPRSYMRRWGCRCSPWMMSNSSRRVSGPSTTGSPSTLPMIANGCIQSR